MSFSLYFHTSFTIFLLSLHAFEHVSIFSWVIWTFSFCTTLPGVIEYESWSFFWHEPGWKCLYPPELHGEEHRLIWLVACSLVFLGLGVKILSLIITSPQGCPPGDATQVGTRVSACSMLWGIGYLFVHTCFYLVNTILYLLSCSHPAVYWYFVDNRETGLLPA